jgi:hypothetical protein
MKGYKPAEARAKPSGKRHLPLGPDVKSFRRQGMVGGTTKKLYAPEQAKECIIEL